MEQLLKGGDCTQAKALENVFKVHLNLWLGDAGISTVKVIAKRARLQPTLSNGCP